MAEREFDDSPPSKRRRLDPEKPSDNATSSTPASTPAAEVDRSNTKGLGRPISPPLSRRRRSRTPTPSTPRVEADAHVPLPSPPAGTQEAPPTIPIPISSTGTDQDTRCVASPIQLTRITDLAPHHNVDTVCLGDILGDPMIKECWNFNFLFNLDFVMKHFDPDIRDQVKVKIVHGFWKREDERRLAMMEAAERYPNLELISAYIPDPFGTHHSKMMILFRHDDLAQVIIHTANMISRDWGNMTQAVWRSPLLPIQSPTPTPPDSQAESQIHPIGSGERFKVDLLRYLDAYGKRLKGLIEQVVKYDFSGIRAAFLGSAPSRQKPIETCPAQRTSFGWLGLHEILSSIPASQTTAGFSPNIVVQVSSIATLGPTPGWLTHFKSVLSRYRKITSQSSTVAVSTSPTQGSNFTKRPVTTAKPISKLPAPTFNVIFPTPQEIRFSLDGYDSGASIHTKLQSPAQQKQLEYLHPIFCHWNPHASPDVQPTPDPSIREAYRGHAAPHIKTYIRYVSIEKKGIDWAMVTSANLSKQAWGELENKKGEVWIQSWETGVVVWPELFQNPDNTKEEVEMVPVFGKDMPELENETEGVEDESGDETGKKVKRMVVGFRMPYDLPLVPYQAEEVPWCATSAHKAPDWKGQVWGGYQPGRH